MEAEIMDLVDNPDVPRKRVKPDTGTDATEMIKKDLLRCIDDGLESYKSLMDSLLEFKQPLKDSQLIDYHTKNLEIIKEAMGIAYKDISKTIAPEIEQLLFQAKKRLETLAKKQLNDIYLRKHEIQIDGIVKKVKGFTNQAEMTYDEKADQYELVGKTSREVKRSHRKWTKEARRGFNRSLRENNIEREKFWSRELKHRLKERLGDLLEEVPKDNSTDDDLLFSSFSTMQSQSDISGNNSPFLMSPTSPPLDKIIDLPRFDNSVVAKEMELDKYSPALLLPGNTAPTKKPPQRPPTLPVTNNSNLNEPSLEPPFSAAKFETFAPPGSPALPGPDQISNPEAAPKITQISTSTSDPKTKSDFLASLFTPPIYSTQSDMRIAPPETSKNIEPIKSHKSLPTEPSVLPEGDRALQPTSANDPGIPTYLTEQVAVNKAGLCQTPPTSQPLSISKAPPSSPVPPEKLWSVPRIVDVIPKNRPQADARLGNPSNSTKISAQLAPVTQSPRSAGTPRLKNPTQVPPIMKRVPVKDPAPMKPPLPTPTQTPAPPYLHPKTTTSGTSPLKIPVAAKTTTITTAPSEGQKLNAYTQSKVPLGLNGHLNSPTTTAAHVNIAAPEKPVLTSESAQPLNHKGNLGQNHTTIQPKGAPWSFETLLPSQPMARAKSASYVNLITPTLYDAELKPFKSVTSNNPSLQMTEPKKIALPVTLQLPAQKPVTPLSNESASPAKRAPVKLYEPYAELRKLAPIEPMPPVQLRTQPALNPKSPTSLQRNPLKVTVTAGTIPCFPSKPKQFVLEQSESISHYSNDAPSLPPKQKWGYRFQESANNRISWNSSQKKDDLYTTASGDVQMQKMQEVMRNYSGINNQGQNHSLQSQMGAAKMLVNSSLIAAKIIERENYPPQPWLNTPDQNNNPPIIEPHENGNIMNIGIYFDNRSFKIGVYEEFKPFMELVSVTPEIYFADSGIITGEAARDHNDSRRYFDVYDLVVGELKDKTTGISKNILKRLNINNNSFTLCPHQIIAAYLQDLLSQIERRFSVQIGKIMFTIPFPPTSNAKENILRAANIAGHGDIRILSTVLTAAISSLDVVEYYRNRYDDYEQTKYSVSESDQDQDVTEVLKSAPKQVFVVEFKKASFSMGIIKMSPASMWVTNPLASENMVECQQELFKRSHIDLYEGHNIDPRFKDYVLGIYKKAISHVFKDAKNFPVDIIFVGDTTFGILLERIALTILKGNAIVFNTEISPLLGASLFASKNRLPPNIQIYDSSRCNLKLTLYKDNGDLIVPFQYMGKQIVQECIFLKKFCVSLDSKNSNHRPVSFLVSLKEVYNSDDSVAEACLYQLTFTLRKDESRLYKSYDLATKVNSKVKVYFDIKGWVSEDGIYSLTADRDFDPSEFPRVNDVIDIDMQRSDNVTCQNSCQNPYGNDFDKLMKYFKWHARQPRQRETFV